MTFEKNYVSYLIFSFPIIFLVIIILGKLIFGPTNDAYVNFIREDGPIEYSTSFIYFILFLASILFGNLFLKSKRNIHGFIFCAFSVVFLFIALEEISWGQRLFGFEIPDFLSSNLQDEITIHNLPVWQNWILNISWIVIGALGSFLWIPFSKINILKKNSILKYIIPEWFFISYFFPIMALFLILQFTKPELITNEFVYFGIFNWKDQEPFEFLLSLGILIFVVRSYFLEKNNVLKKQRLSANFVKNKKKKWILVGISLTIILIVFSFAFVQIMNITLIREFTTENHVQVSKHEIFDSIEKIEDYPNVFPENIISVNIINQTENSKTFEIIVVEAGITSVAIVKQELIPYEQQKFTILNKELKGTIIQLNFEGFDSETLISTNAHIEAKGFTRMYLTLVSDANLSSAVNTFFSPFESHVILNSSQK